MRHKLIRFTHKINYIFFSKLSYAQYACYIVKYVWINFWVGVEYNFYLVALVYEVEAPTAPFDLVNPIPEIGVVEVFLPIPGRYADLNRPPIAEQWQFKCTFQIVNKIPSSER